MAVTVPVIVAVKTVWVAWSNTDLTEGRGDEIALHVCESEETAIRLGKGQYVMGSDCHVTEERAVKLQGEYHWLVPGRIRPESKEEAEARALRQARRDVVRKAKALGLSEDEIGVLTGQVP